MKFDIQRYGLSHVNVKVESGSISIDLGLLNHAEAEELAESLKLAYDSILEDIDEQKLYAKALNVD